MPTKVTKIPSPNTFLTGSASNLVVSREMVRNFNLTTDYVEMFVLNPINQVVLSIPDFKGYQIPALGPQPQLSQQNQEVSTQEIIFDPANDLKNVGVNNGDFTVQYNILRPQIISGNNKPFFIKEISPSRTEIRLSSNTVSPGDLQGGFYTFLLSLTANNYFREFYINLGNNVLLPCINASLDLGPSTQTINPNTGVATSTLSGPPTILIKLLNPLPSNFGVNSLLSIVDLLSNPQRFSVLITPDPILVTFPTLRGANFDLDLDNLRVGPTPYYNFNQITSSQAAFGPLQQLLGQLSASNFTINIDYNKAEYDEWVHFSSAARRLEGFQYKTTNIELFVSASASLATSTSPSAQLDAQNYRNKANDILQSFDGWESYLYYESGAYAYPKQNSTKPYINYSVTSSQAINWYSGSYATASLYDDNNQNYLLYAMPGYIAENDNNELVFKFVASLGQMFDDVWIHIKAISDLYKAKNALDKGISKDLVYFALQSMGIDTYTDEDGENVFRYLYGISPDGSYLPMTGSYDTLVSASQYQMSGQDLQKGIYKRMYHNLPLLLKSKGTTRFIQYLNTVFGIPDTVMSYLEYGGVDKVTSSFEYEYDRFAYALNISGSNTINVPWTYTSQSAVRTGNTDIAPNGIEFRFKAYPTSSFTTQSLFYSGSDIQFNLLFANTASNDSIYSGSTGEFGYFQFKLGGLSVTSSTVPVYYTGSNSDSDNDTDWYSVLVQRTNPDLRIGQTSTSQTYQFFVKNNVWGEIGHKTSASLTTNTAASNSLWYSQGTITFGGGSYPFSGSLQELRLWSNYVSESAFNSHVLNPESIEGNTYSSSFSDLTARWPLGNNLYTSNHSVVTTTASVAPDQTIQGWTASFTNFPNRNNYYSFTETYYADVANSGLANPVTDKVRIVSGSTYGNLLLPNKSIEIQPIIPLTKDIHILDASLSPQDEVDRAIIAAFGSTYDLDNIIGNPATGSYQNLQPLQAEFFKKFVNKYNYKDFIRLIEFFHNSLFRTLKDFTPARTNLSTGIVIKPHLLERPVIYRPEPEFINLEYSQSIDTAFISGSNGGNYSQSIYGYTIEGNMGPVSLTSDARDFFTGVFPSGTLDTFVSQSNPFTTYRPSNTSSYSESIWNYDYNPLLNNVSSVIESNIRRKSEFITSGSRLVQILSSGSIQDFTYTYTRHIRPRYEGSQTNSKNYNFFEDDDLNLWKNSVGPYGRNAVIDRNTIQFAFFSEAVATGSFLIAMPERTNLYVKYLIDATGSLTELTQRNYNVTRNNEFWNLYQVQNIFKSSEVYNVPGVINISLFDNQTPSNQKSLDGNKTIFDSGYKYIPTLWRIAPGVIQNYYVPSGISSIPSLNRSNYLTNVNNRLIIHYLWRETILEGTLQYTGGGNVPYDIDILFLVKTTPTSTGNGITFPSFPLIYSPSYYARTFGVIPVFITMRVNTNSVNWRVDCGDNIRIEGGSPPFIIYSVKPTVGSISGLSFNDRDQNSWLTVHSESIGGNYQPTNIISCSAQMSDYYDDLLYFSGSITAGNITEIDKLNNVYNKFTIPELPFTINPGDVVRFDSTGSTHPTYTFKPENEYTILEVSLPSGSTPLLFKVDRKVDTAVTSSTFGRLDRYVFSKKVPDETNIIIQHTKAIGPTSAGIIKKNNLKLEIDNNVGNIVSELKSKIFSTILTLGN
jgi:hypothetical protein